MVGGTLFIINHPCDAFFWTRSQLFSIFLKPLRIQSTMNRNTIFAMLAGVMLCFGACDDKVSKQFKAFEEEITTIETKISEMTDCDELQMMNFAILGLRSDMDNQRRESEMSDAEIGKLDDMIDKLEATWNGKWATLGCEGNLVGGEFDTSGEEAGDYDYNVL